MITQTEQKAAIKDLYRVPENGKAEIVNGELALMPPTGDSPSRASGSIHASLRQYEREAGTGRAYSDNAGFIVDLPNRESFSPDAAYHVGKSTGMKFLEGSPMRNRLCTDGGCRLTICSCKNADPDWSAKR